MKRRGRKSLSQTPSPKADKIYGSKKNPKGSASSEEKAKKISLSSKTIESLKNKLTEFKKSHKTEKVNINDLKAVYRRGSGAYSSSHRPTISGGKPNTRNAWAMARVNKFLQKAGGKKVKKAYVQDDDLLKYEKGGEAGKYKFSLVIKNIKNPNESYKSVKNKYRGAYEKIFKILEDDAIFTSWESSEEKLEGNDLYLYFDKLPDLDKVERISKIPNVEIMNKYKEGGKVDENEETYDKWKSLVNMSSGELKNFYDSEEGKKAGLSQSEANKQGIDSGRESARWIMKMKQTPKSKWTPNMWRWARKQISFISRMSGMKGGLYQPNGEKTRKHLALLIWGHNPKKYDMGGNIISLPDTSSEFERLRDILDQQGYVLSKKDTHLLKVAPSLDQIAEKHQVSKDYLEDQLQMGVKEEMEHTDNPEVAQTIALHHLYEDYKYYSHLEEMMIKSKEEEEYDRSIQETITNYKSGGYLVGEKDGKTIKHNNGDLGGVLVGKRHSEGGIKGINKSTNQPIEVEGGEIEIGSNAIKSDRKNTLNGRTMTNREVLSKLNVDGGGVAFKNGGELSDNNRSHKVIKDGYGNPIEYSGGEVILTRGAVSNPKRYEFNGEKLTTKEIASKINESGGGVSFDKGGKVESDENDDDCGCNHYDDGGEIVMFGIQYPELTPSEMLDKMFEDNCEIHELDHVYDKGGLIRLVDKKVASYKEFLSKNPDLSASSQKKAYKNYLSNVHSVTFDELPQQMKMGLLLGNQNLINKYINS